MNELYQSSNEQQINLKKYRIIYICVGMMLIILHVIILASFQRGEVFLFVTISSFLDIFVMASLFFHFHIRYLPQKKYIKLFERIQNKNKSYFEGTIIKISTVPLTYLNLSCFEVMAEDLQKNTRLFYIEQRFKDILTTDQMFSFVYVDALIVGQRRYNNESDD